MSRRPIRPTHSGRRAAVTALTALAGVLAPLAAPAAVQAQQSPPPPLPLEELSFPDFDERTLANGAELIVVPQHEQPFVTVNLVIGAGSAMDPAGSAGLASMVAQLLTKGTESRTDLEIAEAIDFMGASLNASASEEWTTISLGVLTPDLDEGLELLADVVMNPTFRTEELELLRTQTLTGLRLELSQASALASRTFTRAVYGEHPYGMLETPESIESLGRDDAAAFHERYFHPTNALFVVAGDVEADGMARALERHFGGWTPAEAVPDVDADPPSRSAREVILVHKPGSVQSVVRIGHALMPGDADDWTPFTVANRILGGGSSGRLFKVLREERGWTYGAYSQAQRERDEGVFQVTMEVRNEVTDSAVAEAFALLEALRDEPIPADELQETKDYLVGSFPLNVETPQQIASQVSRNRLLGLPLEELTTYRSRVAALDPEDVRAVARRHLDPDRMVVVVVGDAEEVLDQIAGFGEVRLVDVEGNPLELADLEVGGAEVALDARSLEPGSWTYDIVFQGQSLGQVTRTLEAGTEEGTLVYRSEMDAAGTRAEESVTFLKEGFGPVSAETRIQAMGQEMGGGVTFAEGRVVGQVAGPEGDREIDVEAPAGTVLGDMAELALWIHDLAEGETFSLPRISLEEGRLTEVSYEVKGPTEVTVPAGTFDAWEVEMTTPQGAQTLFVRREAPHVTLRIEVAAQPVSFELSSAP